MAIGYMSNPYGMTPAFSPMMTTNAMQRPPLPADSVYGAAMRPTPQPMYPSNPVQSPQVDPAPVQISGGIGGFGGQPLQLLFGGGGTGIGVQDPMRPMPPMFGGGMRPFPFRPMYGGGMQAPMYGGGMQAPMFGGGMRPMPPMFGGGMRPPMRPMPPMMFGGGMRPTQPRPTDAMYGGMRPPMRPMPTGGIGGLAGMMRGFA